MPSSSSSIEMSDVELADGGNPFQPSNSLRHSPKDGEAEKKESKERDRRERKEKRERRRKEVEKERDKKERERCERERKEREMIDPKEKGMEPGGLTSASKRQRSDEEDGPVPRSRKEGKMTGGERERPSESNKDDMSEISCLKLDQVRSALENIGLTFVDLGSRVNNVHRATIHKSEVDILEATGQLAVLFEKERGERRRLESILELLFNKGEVHPSTQTSGPPMMLGPPTRSYASALRTGGGTERRVEPKRPTLLIYPANPEGTTSEETKKKIQEVINPRTDGFIPVRVKKVRQAGILIETSNKVGQVSIKKAVDKLKSQGLNLVEPKGHLPRLVVHNVPRDIGEGEFLDELYSSNLEGKISLNKEQLKNTTRRVALFGPRDRPDVGCIYTVHPEVRKVLIQQGHILVGWSSCRTRDYVGATRCHKCHLYGHVAKFCSQEAEVCRHCASSGHGDMACPNKGNAAKCATCTRFKKPNSHATGSRECPAYQSACEAYIRRTDYGL
jgi:hypothetical protein